MKTNGWLVLGAMLSTSVFAQQMTTPPPAAAPAPEAAVKSAKKKAAPEKKIAFVEKAVSLTSGPATIVGNNINVRGQATLNSEVITRLNDGDAVTVLEQITLEKHKADEPAQWAKIVLPESGHVWVNAAFIDPTNLSVVPNKLNMRGGPGENYSILGVLERGATVREILTENNWMRIGVPPSAYAFVAAIYLKQEVPVAAVVTPPSAPAEPAPAPAPVVVPAPAPTELAPLPAPATNVVETPSAAPAATPVVAPAPEPVPATPPVEEPLPKRIVQHEGIVKGTWSIQAPTRFALVDPDSGKTINYLYTSSRNLDLSRYKGLRIVVTGEEGLDERWKNTPVITIQRIQVVE